MFLKFLLHQLKHQQELSLFQHLISNQNYKLLQNFSYLTHSDTFGEIFQRKSYNNGEKWTEPELIFKPYKTKEGVLRIGESCLFFDTEKESILRFFNLSIYPDDTFSGSSLKLTRIFYQISFDQGESFSQPIQLTRLYFSVLPSFYEYRIQL